MSWYFAHFEDKDTEAQIIEMAYASVAAGKWQSIGSNQAV